jgi:hypothetical protein
MSITKIYLTDSCWAYEGVYQSIGTLPGISDRGEKLWTMLGALLYELDQTGEHRVVIYNDSRLVQEWNEEIGFISPLSKKIAARLKDKDGLASRFFNLSLERADSISINSQIKSLQLT